MTRRSRHGHFDPDFTNLSLEAMAERVKERTRRRRRRNITVALLLIVAVAIAIALLTYFYSDWARELISATGGMVVTSG